MTISVSMLISAIIALTLSPALCALFLRHHGRAARPGGLDADRHRQGPRRLRRGGATGCCGVAVLSLWSSPRAGVGIVYLGKITPTGFLPEEDQGAFFTVVQLPDGASVERTRDVVAAGRGPDPADAAGRGGAVDRRLLAAGWRQSAERRLPRCPAEAVPGPAGAADGVRRP